MGRYRDASGSEGDAQPGSRARVPRNRLGIVRKRDLDRAEYDRLVHVQLEYLDRINLETKFTAAMIRDMHRDWLADLYDWAGQYRTVELAKGGFRWPPAHRVPA